MRPADPIVHDQSTADLGTKLVRFLTDLAIGSGIQFHDDGFPRRALNENAAGFLAALRDGRLVLTDGVGEVDRG